MHKPDKLLEAAVREELLWDPRLDDQARGRKSPERAGHAERLGAQL